MQKQWFFRVFLGCFLVGSVYGKEYIVQSGDTLLSISRRTGIDVLYIRRLNELIGDTLRIGQKLVIPDKLVKYMVQPGDSLLGIARRYETTLSALILCNQLSDERIFVGQKLMIPCFSGSEQREEKSSLSERTSSSQGEISRGAEDQPIRWHRVAEGDTLYSIAKKYRVSVDNILSWNAKKSAVIYPGEQLKIFVSGEAHNRALASRPLGEKWAGDFPIEREQVVSYTPTSRGIRIMVGGDVLLRATMNGVVEYTGWLYGFGNVVILSLGGERRIVFGELENITVRKGQKIAQGDVLARIREGQSFYLEIREGTTVLDPVKWYNLTLAQKKKEKEVSSF